MKRVNASSFKCKGCGEEFYRFNKVRRGRTLSRGIKRKGAVTCSRKCSKIEQVMRQCKNVKKWTR